MIQASSGQGKPDTRPVYCVLKMKREKPKQSLGLGGLQVRCGSGLLELEGVGSAVQAPGLSDGNGE